MKILSISLAIFAVTLSLASADTTISSYHAVFSNKDFFSSNGARLKGTAAVIQQDRANFHKFFKRDGSDTDCGFFSSAANRAQIPAMLKRGGVPESLLREIDEESLWGITIMQNNNGQYYLIVNLLAG